jgi:hypothetical protein
MLLLGASASQAAVLAFSYNEAPGGPVLSGILTGDLQPDGNTFLVTAVGPAYLDGVQGADLPLVYSPDNYLGIDSAAVPTVTLDGTFMDLLACANNQCVGDGILFASGDQASAGSPTFEGGGTYGGGIIATYDPSQWSATLDPVPEPGTLGLGLTAGLALLVWKKRSGAR